MFLVQRGCLSKSKRNPAFAIMGDDDTVMLDDLLSTPKLDTDTEH